MAATPKRWPGEQEVTYPDVFNINAMPPQPTEKKPGQLPEAMIRQFFEKGYVIVDSFFDKKYLDACRDAIGVFVDELAESLLNGGKITSLYKEFGLFERLTQIEKEFPGANIILHKLGVLPQAFKDVWSHPHLLNLVLSLIHI